MSNTIQQSVSDKAFESALFALRTGNEIDQKILEEYDWLPDYAAYVDDVLGSSQPAQRERRAWLTKKDTRYYLSDSGARYRYR